MAKYKMIRTINYKYKSSGAAGTIDMLVDLGRFEKQYQRAQYRLDSLVMSGMEPFMPMDSGVFVKLTKAMSAAVAGSGLVYAAAPPFGRYLYYGNVMIDEKTGSPYARRGARKVLVSQYAGKTNAKEKLNFSKGVHPRATEQWFEEAKKTYGKMWVAKTKQIAGGGKRG